MVAPVVPVPWAIAADLARPVIGPDHAAVAVPVAIVIRVSVIARRVEAAVEVMPVIEVRPVIDMAISVAIAAAMEHARRAIAAAAKNGRGTKAAAVERSAAASESAAVKPAAAETTASTTAETASAAMTAATTVPNFGRQAIDCVFDRGRSARTRKRERLGALLGCRRKRKYGRSRKAQTTKPRPGPDIVMDESSLTGDDALLRLAAGSRRFQSRSLPT